MIDDHTLEVEVEKSKSINELFAALSDVGIHVEYAQQNQPPEELFFNLVEKNLSADGALPRGKK